MKKTLILFFGLIMFTGSLSPFQLRLNVAPLCVVVGAEKQDSCLARFLGSFTAEDVFTLDLTPSQLLKALEANGIKMNAASEEDYADAVKYLGVENPVKDGRRYNHDMTFYYDCGDIYFSFSEYGDLRSIMVRGAGYKTTKGAKVGDSVESIKRTYRGACNERNLAYRVKGGYIQFFVDSAKPDTIYSWRICREL